MTTYSTHTGRKVSSGAPAKQDWQIGEMVNVGFIKNLMVVRKEPTPGDYMPDAYHLVARSGATYRFVPHNGIANGPTDATLPSHRWSQSRPESRTTSRAMARRTQSELEAITASVRMARSAHSERAWLH